MMMMMMMMTFPWKIIYHLLKILATDRMYQNIVLQAVLM
jgi:hypothetical protein